MSKELNRMKELAGVPAKKEAESLNEHQIGGIVGVGAINQIPPREKTDYEMAFEHFMTEGEEKEVEEGMYEEDNMKESYYEEDDTVEEADGAMDVKTIDKILPKINTKSEYMELLPKIIGLDIAGVTPQAKKTLLLSLAKELK
tara:strand:- start:306 stop:734 length:429 start_codon:yes stop_codon:yes gene_type:complete